MMDFNERLIPGISSNFLYQEALARYLFAFTLLDKNAKILDMGCGTGYGAKVLAPRGKFIGVDVNNEAIDFARKNYGNYGEFYVGNVENMTFKAMSFDAICSFEVMEHLKSSRKYLQEASRVLVGKGVFIMSTPNKDFTKAVGAVDSQYHINEYGYEELVTMLEKYFSKVKIYGQSKSKKAQDAFLTFLDSQDTRQSLVNFDLLGLRRFFPRNFKEKVWGFLGMLFGAKKQRELNVGDFPITNDSVESAEYFVAVCQKK